MWRLSYLSVAAYDWGLLEKAETGPNAFSICVYAEVITPGRVTVGLQKATPDWLFSARSMYMTCSSLNAWHPHATSARVSWGALHAICMNSILSCGRKADKKMVA